MGRERALKAIDLQPTDRVPQWVIMSNPDYVRRLTGIDPFQHRREAYLRCFKLLDIEIADGDVNIELREPGESGLAEEPARNTAQGQHEVRTSQWGVFGTAWDRPQMAKTAEEILAFEPREPANLIGTEYWEIAAKSVDELAVLYQDRFHRMQAALGESSLVYAYFYCTLFMWSIMLFGWEPFLEAAASEPAKFRVLLDKFAALSLKVTSAWAKTDIELFVSHDDICMTRGPVFNPLWYREHVFPWYREIWRPLKEAGKKIVFMSDGRIDRVAGDVMAAGADGVYFEPVSDLEYLVREFGRDKILIGNADVKILTFGTREDVVNEVRRCMTLGRDCPGYFISVSNHIPQNVPVENIETYFQACREYGRR